MTKTRRALKTTTQKEAELKVVAPNYELAASGYYRVVLPLKTLVDQGQVQAIWRDLLPFKSEKELEESEELQKLMARILSWANIYFLERESRAETIVPILRKAKAQGRAIIFDLDDHLMAFTGISYEPVAKVWRNRAGGLLAILNEVDLLIASTDSLALAYREFLPRGGEMVAIPLYIDTYHPRWKVVAKKNSKLTLGWMGGPTHEEDLKILIEPLKLLLARHPTVQFKCVGLKPDWLVELPQDQVLHQGYTALDQYPAHFADFDIGLIPLENSEFNRIGKSDLKFLEYSMFGIASVASKVSAYRGSLGHRKRGLLAENDPVSWIEAISALIESPELRNKLGTEAQSYVLNYRAIGPNAHRWVTAFEQARRIRRKKLKKGEV